jgi:hypothetical protein
MFLICVCLIWPIALTAILMEACLLMAAFVLWGIWPSQRPGLARFMATMNFYMAKATRMMCCRW